MRIDSAYSRSHGIECVVYNFIEHHNFSANTLEHNIALVELSCYIDNVNMPTLPTRNYFAPVNTPARTVNWLGDTFTEQIRFMQNMPLNRFVLCKICR